uniref:Protein phosphatase 4 regulatory subunit 2 n=1 Tax=Macaca nemestrina TaxID=9545 RepID=A0A2K6ECJ9_MACNE
MDVERLQEALRDFEKRRGKEVCPILDQILKIVAGFNGIPFTVQRLCELLTDPRRNYTGTDKFLRGVEKNVMVISCVYPSSEKNNSNSLNRMNGVMFPGNSPSYTERSNINGWVWWQAPVSPLLGRLRQENGVNSGGGACSEPRWCHCTSAWVTEQDSVSEKKKNLALVKPWKS